MYLGPLLQAVAKNAVNVIIHFVYVMMHGFLPDHSLEFILVEVIFVTLYEMFIHRGRGLFLQIFVHLWNGKRE